MTFTPYNPAETLDRDKVRGLVGDTVDVDSMFLHDETIAADVTSEGNVLAAAVKCCDRILALKARDFDRSGMGMSSSRSQLQQHYADLKKSLLDRITRQGGQMFVGGISISAAETLESNTDDPQPQFKIGDHDYPGT